MVRSQYPYVVTAEALRDFLVRLKSVGVPERINREYLRTLGFKSSNHKSIPPVLKFVGLIDAAGKPTERYRDALRDQTEGPEALGQLIREAYSALFQVYPEANRVDADRLRNFFSAKTDLGERAITAIIATFQTLCSQASFNGVVPSGASGTVEPKADVNGPSDIPAAGSRGMSRVQFQVNINVDQGTSKEELKEVLVAIREYLNAG